MSDTSKVFMVPDNVNSGTSAAETMALLNNLNSWTNNPFIYLVWMMMFRNGFWGNNLDSTAENYNSRAISLLLDTVNTNHNNDLAFLAITGNGKALSDLAGNLNVGVATLSNAISDIKGAISLVGSENNTNALGIINSVLLGNKDLVQLIATCCCENKQLVTTMGYEGQLRDLANTSSILSRIDLFSNGVSQGFSEVGYATQALTNSLSRDLQNLTLTIVDKISAMEANAQLDKINTLTAQLTAANARAERAAELQPIINQLNSIKAAQPATATITYPNLTAYPSYLNSAAYNSVYGSGNGFWN